MKNKKINSTTFETKREAKPIGPSVEMKTETAGKIGLFGAISIIIGAVFGVGIFLKNNGVFKNNNGNPWGVLLSWGLVFIIAFGTAFSYAEITRVRTRTANSGLSGWSERYVGYNFSRFLKIMYPFFYYSVYLFAMSIFFAEALFCINPNFLQPDSSGQIVQPTITGQSMWSIWGIGFGVSLLMLMANWINGYFVSKSMMPISIIKFVPILMVIIFGIWGGIQSHGGYFNPDNYNKEQFNSGEFNPKGVLNSLPAIMFAFDSFLIVGNVSENVKNPKKNVPISIIVSMIICGVFYILVTISQLLCGYGNPYGIFQKIFANNETLKTTFTVIISVLMSISLFGCVTSLSAAFINTTQAAVNEEVIIGSRTMKKITNGAKNKTTGGFIMSAIIISFWFILVGVISAVLNTDQIVDGLSNICVVLIFTVYGFVSLMSVVNRFTHRVPQSEVSYQKGQVVFATIGTLGCFLVPLYQMIYVFIIQVAQNPNDTYGAWGLFWGGNHISSLVACLIFWVGVILFIGFPFLNDLLIKLINKKYSQALLWQRVKVNNNIKVKK